MIGTFARQGSLFGSLSFPVIEIRENVKFTQESIGRQRKI